MRQRLRQAEDAYYRAYPQAVRPIYGPRNQMPGYIRPSYAVSQATTARHQHTTHHQPAQLALAIQ